MTHDHPGPSPHDSTTDANRPPGGPAGAATDHGGHPHGHPGGHPHGDETSGHPHGQDTSDSGSERPSRDFDRTPLIVTWEVTQACGLTCDHCRADANPDRDPDELTTEEGKALVDQVVSFGTPPPILVLSGGDPLERPDLFEVVDYATAHGLPTAVTPAPTENLTADTIQRFADSGVDRIALSLDGATADRHDAFRGEEGSYELIRRAARQAAAADLPIQINTTVTANTVEDLPAIADQVAELGAVMWEVFFLVPIGRGEELEQLSPDRADDVMAWLYRRQRDAPFRVITVEAPQYRRVAREIEREESGRDVRVGSTRAGKGFVFVSHRGEVFPSGFMPRSVGDVREDDLVSLYRDSQFMKRLRDPRQYAGACGTCDLRDLCGGSRSRAFAATGDPFASDPLCPLVEETARSSD
jgi:radical SAM protein with 4Fe4S-binding SPASM domain